MTKQEFKQELLENNTEEQLAEMVIRKQNIIDDIKTNIDCLNKDLERNKRVINQIDYILEKLFGVRHDIIDNPDEFEKILTEKVHELEEVKRYQKDFYETKKERDYQVCEYQKMINDLEHDFKTAREKIQDLADENMKLQCERNDYKSKLEFLEAERMRVKKNEIIDFLSTEPIKVADMLISATYTRKKGDMEKALHKAFGNNADTVTENVYTESELKQIAEHLLVYCNYNE